MRLKSVCFPGFWMPILVQGGTGDVLWVHSQAGLWWSCGLRSSRIPHSCVAGTPAHLISWKIKPHNLHSGKPPMQLSRFSPIQERGVKVLLPGNTKREICLHLFFIPSPFLERQFIWVFLDSSHQNQIQEREVILSTVLEKRSSGK